MKRLIIVADWASDSLTNAEVKIAIDGFLKNSLGSNAVFVSSTPSTIHSSYLTYQIVEDVERYGAPLETVIFQNTDPRLHENEKVEKAAGAKPVILKTKSGIFLVGPNSGYCFSLIREKIDKLYTYSGVNEKGQFHSRDLYSRLSAHLMDYMEDSLELEEIFLQEIPVLEGSYIGHIDNYGNIKTTITENELKGRYEYQDMVNVEINGITKKAKYVENLFGGIPGELVIYPGSSGQKNNRFIEITVWRHFTEKDPTTGRDLFKNPKPGNYVKIF